MEVTGVSWARTNCKLLRSSSTLGLESAADAGKSQVEAELEEIVEALREGTVESRSAAAERLFNKAAEDDTARQRTASLGVVQPLVRLLLSQSSPFRTLTSYAKL